MREILRSRLSVVSGSGIEDDLNTLIRSSPTSQELKDCWDAWSRCTTATSIFTGWLWKSCDAHCKKDLGRGGGNCVLVDNYCPPLKEKYPQILQCQCY